MDNEFPIRLKQAMERAGINQTQLGMRSGVTPTKVNRYVKGIYKPKQDALKAIAKVLGVTPEWLSTGIDDEREFKFEDLSELEKKAINLFLYPGISEIYTLQYSSPFKSYINC